MLILKLLFSKRERNKHYIRNCILCCQCFIFRNWLICNCHIYNGYFFCLFIDILIFELHCSINCCFRLNLCCDLILRLQLQFYCISSELMLYSFKLCDLKFCSSNNNSFISNSNRIYSIV